MLLFDTSLAAQEHEVDIRLNVVLNIDVVVPIFLRKFSSLVISARDVTNLAFNFFQLHLAIADIPTEDCSNKHPHEEEEESDSYSLCNRLD